MEPSVKGTKTEQNLLKSFAGESQASRRYRLFAKQARKDGYEQIAALFEETAKEEDRHAAEFFKLMEGGAVEITAAYPAGVVGDTAANLLAAAEGESEEWTVLYSQFANTAREEGFSKIAAKFKLIATVEKRHEARYRKLLENIRQQNVFKRNGAAKWHCRECGYVHEGNGAPDVCPLCNHPMAYYELLAENF